MTELPLDTFISSFIQSKLPSQGLMRPGLDDCACVPLPDGGSLVITTDFVNAKPAFREFGIPGGYDVLGCLAATANLSDLFSSGATPLALTLNLMLPPKEATSQLEHFLNGALRVSQRWEVPIVGGDTKGASYTCAAGTAVGYLEPSHSYLARWNARPGDVILLSAPVGAFNAAVMLLSRDPARASDPAIVAALVSPELSPIPALELARRGIRAACADISDGLAVDLGRIARASSVNVAVDTGRLPIGPLVSEAALSFGIHPASICFGVGGEWANILCVDEKDAAPALHSGAIAIGRVLPGNGDVLACHQNRCTIIGDRGHSDGAFPSFAEEVLALTRRVDGLIDQVSP